MIRLEGNSQSPKATYGKTFNKPGYPVSANYDVNGRQIPDGTDANKITTYYIPSKGYYLGYSAKTGAWIKSDRNFGGGVMRIIKWNVRTSINNGDPNPEANISLQEFNAILESKPDYSIQNKSHRFINLLKKIFLFVNMI